MKLSRLQIITALKEQTCSPAKKDFIKKFSEYVCEEMKLNPKQLNQELKITAGNIRRDYMAIGIWVTLRSV